MQWNMDHSRHNIEDVAAGYEALPKYDPKAEHAWQQLAAESKKHADYIRQHLNVTETDNPEPYDTSEDMIRDIRNNRNFVVSTANSEHPIWTPEQNVDFRIVHDVFGHAATEGDFGWHGENDACSTHFALSSPHAQKALATECLGQTGYAIHRGNFTDQKVGFIPGLHEGLAAANKDTPIPTQAQLMQRALYGPPKQSKWLISGKPKYDPKELKMGIQVEKEHKDTVGDDPKIWEQIAKDHLDEMPDYYTRLKKMEESGKKKSNWKIAANPATEQRIQRIADEARSKGLEVQQYDNDGYLETQIHIGQDEYYDSRYVIYISHGKNRTQSVFYDRPESKDYKTNLSAIEQEISLIKPENFDEMEFGRQTEMFNDKKILWNRYSRWKIAESQDANRMYRQHTDGTPVAETTFESIQNKDTSEPYEDEYIIVDGKKWKKVRRKNNPQPDNYKDPIGGWGFYSKLLDKMEKQPWTIVSVEKANPIDVDNIDQYQIPRSYKIVDQLVPHFARYGVIPIARKFSNTIEGAPVNELPEGGGFNRDIDYTYNHNIHLYDPETQQIVYGMEYSLNHPDAFEHHSTDEDGNPIYDNPEWAEQEFYEHKYPTYVNSIHYNQPGNHEGANDPRFHEGGRIYLSDLDEKGKPTALFGDYKETVDNFNKRYPRLSLSVLRWMQQNLPKPIGADIINPKLREKAEKQDFVTLSKWKLSVPPAEKAEEYAKGYEKSEEPDPEYLQERYKWNPEVRGHRWKLNYENLEKAFNHPDFPVKGKYNVFTVDPKSAPTDDITMKHWKRTPLGTHEAASPNRAGSIHINPLISAESANEALWHELQHAYQDQEGRFTPEMRENYFDPTDIAGLSDEEVERKFKENYLEHPMEIDANKFADFMRRYPLIEESDPIYKSRWVNFSMANKDVNDEIKSIIDKYYQEHGSQRRLPLPSIESKWKKRATYLPGFYSTTLVPDEENGGYKMIVATDERMSHWDIHPANGTYPEYRGLYSPEFKQILHLSSPEEYDIRRDILPSEEHLKATPEEHEKTWMDAASKGAHFVAPSGDKGNYGDLPNNVRGLLKDETKLNVIDKKPIKVESVHAMHKREGIPNEEFKFRFNTPEENSEKYWHQVTFASPSPKESKWKIAGKTKTRLLQDAKDLDENYTDTSEIVHKFDDGWTIRKLNTIGDAHREGTLMSNCMTPEGDWPPPYCDVAARIDPNFSIERHKDFPWEDYYDEKIRKDDEAIYSLRDPENLPHATYDSGDGSGFDSPILGRHNDLPKPEYRKYWDEWFKANKKQPFYWDQWDKQSKWIRKEAPARSKAQFRYMQGICNGSIEPPEGMTRAQACEYVEGQKDYKDLPEKKSKLDMQQDLEKILMKQGFSEKGAILMALDYMSKLSYWIDGYHAAVALRDPESGDWHMDIGFSDKLTHGGVTADYINDLGTKAMRKAVGDKDSRTDYYNYHTARGLYNPITKDFIHMSHPDFWDETEYNFKDLDQDSRNRMEEFWRQLAEQNNIELGNVRVLNNQTGHIEDLSVSDLEMPEEVQRTMRMKERERPLTPWEREHGGYDTKTGSVKKAHWIDGFQAAIINQKGELEVAPPNKEILDENGNVIDIDDTPWYASHWDVGGYPNYRGLYNHDTGELIHMTSPEEHTSLGNMQEYLNSKDDAINPLEHETIWREAAKKSNIPINNFKLLYEKEEDEYGDEPPYKRWSDSTNQKEDFLLVDPEEFMPKQSKWKKRGHWLKGYHAAVITPKGEMKVAKDWTQFHGSLLPDAATLADKNFHRGLYNKETGQLLHMTSPEEWDKLENSWNYKEEDPKKQWPIGFEWFSNPEHFISPYQTEKQWLKASENSGIPVSEVKFFSGEPEANPYTGFDVNKFNLHSPDDIAKIRMSKWKASKKDAWEAVLDGELGHDIITTGTWEEVKKQTIKWLKQLKNGYINKKNPHDNKKIDAEAKEQDAHALEDLKLYEEKKRWSFHFDHGKHPYDLIIQPVGYKESSNKISQNNIEFELEDNEEWGNIYALLNNNLIGNLAFEKDDEDNFINIKFVRVEKEYRNRGIGKALLEKLNENYPYYEFQTSGVTPLGERLVNSFERDFGKEIDWWENAPPEYSDEIPHKESKWKISMAVRGRPLSSDQINQLIKDYEAGMSLDEVSRKNNLNRITVRKYLILNNIDRRGPSSPRGKIRQEELEKRKQEINQKRNYQRNENIDIINDYIRGVGISELAFKYNTNYQAIRRILLRNNIPLNTTPRIPKIETPKVEFNTKSKTVNKILDLYYNKNKNIQEISNEFNQTLSQQNIRNIIKQYGLKQSKWKKSQKNIIDHLVSQGHRYLYHSANYNQQFNWPESDANDYYEKIKNIMSNGLRPQRELGFSSAPRSYGGHPDFVYLSSDPAEIIVDITKLNPNNFVADDDMYLSEWQDAEEGYGTDLGEWVHNESGLVRPEDVFDSISATGAIAYRGTIPPQALSINPGFLDKNYRKKSKWRKRSHWVEGFHAAGITPEGEMVVGPKWTTYHGELKTPNSIHKTFDPRAGWRGLYNPDTNELLHLTTPEEYGRFIYTETAEDLEDFKNPHDFYREAWQSAADKSNYPVESISLFVDKNNVNPAERNDRGSFDLTKIGKWKVSDKKKNKVHPKFQTSLKDHKRSVRKRGPLKTHGVRNFKKKSVLNSEEGQALFEYEPYMYHDVAAARTKGELQDQIDTVRSILNNGILPKEQTGVSEYTDWLTSRPDHVYIGRKGFYPRTVPPAIRINMSKVDPSTLKPDEDIYHAFGFSDKHKDQIDMHELKSAPFEEEHRNNPDYTLGQWMEDHSHLDTPKNVLASYLLNNSLAVHGGVPADALEINPEWVDHIKDRHGIDITKML